MSLFAVSASPAVAARARLRRAPAPPTRCAASARCASIAGGSRAPARASPAFFGARTGLVAHRDIETRARRGGLVAARAAAAAGGTKIITQGIHLEITESIKTYAETKINKAVSHFDLHDVREVDVRCSARGGEKQLGGDAHKTTVSVYTKNGVVRAEEEADDLYASIDAVSDKLERKLRKLKEKKKSQRPGHNKNNPRSATAAAVEAAAECRGERRRNRLRRTRRRAVPGGAQVHRRRRRGGDGDFEPHVLRVQEHRAGRGRERRVQALGRRVRRDRAGGHGLTSDAKETPPSRRAYVFVGARDGF